MTVNWIGLYTMIRREVQRLMRVPIQAVVAPLISALLFIFIFGFVVIFAMAFLPTIIFLLGTAFVVGAMMKFPTRGPGLGKSRPHARPHPTAKDARRRR